MVLSNAYVGLVQLLAAQSLDDIPHLVLAKCVCDGNNLFVHGALIFDDERDKATDVTFICEDSLCVTVAVDDVGTREQDSVVQLPTMIDQNASEGTGIKSCPHLGTGGNEN